LLASEQGDSLRENFLRNFTVEQYLSGMAEALNRLERNEPGTEFIAGSPSVSHSA